MGQLLQGKTLSWQRTKELAPFLRKAATRQLIKAFKHHYQATTTPLSQIKWGYEIEFFTVKSHPSIVELLPVATQLLCLLNESGTGKWNPEYASFMVESTPIAPFSLSTSSLGESVLEVMKMQRNSLNQLLSSNFGSNSLAISIGSFPLLGSIVSPHQCPNSLSFRFPTNFINDHPRFATLTRNIVERRGKRPIDIQVPLYQDRNSRHDDRIIRMDAMGFGMGCCCLQTTTEMGSFEEACCIYDELLAFAPVALALSASSPAFRGFLSGEDCRWRVLEGAVDDRTEEEISNGHLKSRFSPSQSYLSGTNEQLNDVEIPVDHEVLYSLLREGHMPGSLAKHYAHTFYRDPLVAYEGTDYEDQTVDSRPEESTKFIDAFQSINWNSVRFKMPSMGCGWRVEFRPMEVQPSDFENAAFCIFVEGLILALMEARRRGEQVSFVVPISQVNQNFTTAIRIDAVRREKFLWRTIARKSTQLEEHSAASSTCDLTAVLKDDLTDESSIGTVSVDEIVNGEGTGILPLMRKFAPKFFAENEPFLDFVGKRAAGLNETPAKRIRNLVLSHPDYRHDSVISDSIMKTILESVQ